MIVRTTHLERLSRLLRQFPVVAVLGARQVGKSTLARTLAERAPGEPHYFDLEDPASLARLEEPLTALAPLDGLVVIDEVQRRPDLFPVLRVLTDRREQRARFLILGSASGELLRQSSESLAGRVERIRIGGFTLQETGAEASGRLWLRGTFPRSYLAPSEEASLAWRSQFAQNLGQAKAVIFYMGSVPTMDVTGLVALETAIRKLQTAGALVVLADVQSQPAEVLARAGLRRDPGRLSICRTLSEAEMLVRLAVPGETATAA